MRLSLNQSNKKSMDMDRTCMHMAMDCCCTEKMKLNENYLSDFPVTVFQGQ